MLLNTDFSSDYIDKYTTIVSKEMNIYRCKWSDLILPQALFKKGWSRQPDHAEVTNGRNVITFERSISAGFLDRISFDAKRAFCLVKREIVLGSDVGISLEYSNIIDIDEKHCIPRTCTWKVSGSLYKQTIVRLKLNRRDDNSPPVVYLPGSVIIDARTNSIVVSRDGEDFLDESLARAQVLFSHREKVSNNGDVIAIRAAILMGTFVSVLLLVWIKRIR
jgi:hypothetical protein